MWSEMLDEAVDIFTFSTGAGAAGTCQLLNGYDLLGRLTVKPYLQTVANLAIATKACGLCR